MTFARSSLAAAEREASDLTAAAQRSGSAYRYHAQRYPNGTSHVASWPWGVARIQGDYYESPRHAPRARFDGFVWKREEPTTHEHVRRFRR